MNDTIAAAATGAVQAGIGIIRVSGPEAIDVCNTVYKNHKGEHMLPYYAPNTIHFGYIYEPGEDDPVDEVLISVFKAPHSYTAEDTVEINTHGGLYIEKRILELVIRAGARHAEPGEFTKRAFLNGRLDLSRAEAVMDLISSQNEFARRSAMAQLGGNLSARIRSLREEILYEMARIEAALDDPEHYDLDGYDTIIAGKLSEWLDITGRLIGSAREGRIHREGIRTAVVGRPNAGKSSILNCLTDSERAIVTDIPGTTRDTLEETVRIGDTQLVLIDTAGIRSQDDISDDPVERIGIGRSIKAIKEADLIFAVLDGSQALSEEDRLLAAEIASALSGSREQTDLPAIIILINKCDVARTADTEEAVRIYSEVMNEKALSAADISALYCSAKTGDGIEALKEKVQELFCSTNISKEQIWVTNSRHVALMENAAASLEMVRTAVSNGVSEDLYVIDLMNAYTSLGKIIGEAVEDDLVDEIFSSFCMGK